jgi:hypothetical protein
MIDRVRAKIITRCRSAVAHSRENWASTAAGGPGTEIKGTFKLDAKSSSAFAQSRLYRVV